MLFIIWTCHWKIGGKQHGQIKLWKRWKPLFLSPCATNNLLLFWNQLNVFKPHQNMICNHFFNSWEVFKLRLAIQQIVDDHDWSTFVNTLCGAHRQKSFIEAKVQVHMKKDEFWDTCTNFVHMVELILMLIKAFDGKQFYMGKTWLFMKTLEWHVLIIMKCIIWIIIKPCRCDLKSILPKMEGVDNQFTWCKGPFQSIVTRWNSPTWWCICERGVKQSFAKNN